MTKGSAALFAAEVKRTRRLAEDLRARICIGNGVDQPVDRGLVGKLPLMADAILFLASDRASYVNGDEIIVDGGFTRTIMNLVPRPGHGS